MNAQAKPTLRSGDFITHLTSFLQDNVAGISRNDLINKCPEVFGKGSETEGTFSPENFDVLERLFPIKATLLAARGFHFAIPNESPFFLVAWGGDKGQIRWVRFAGEDDKKVYLVNPFVPNKNDGVDSATFWSWPKIGFMLECSIRRSCL
ncbi:MAG: hypothetical protein ACREC8_04960 [Limisphaerales bacterium]